MNLPSYVDVDGRRTRVRIEGDRTSTPVLLLHGLGRSLEDWGPQYSLLAQSYRVIALDIPGFGFSERDPAPTTLEVLARGVAQTLDALDETRAVHVVGNSLGGAVAMQLLVRAPERVASLTLVDSAGFGAQVSPLLRLLTIPGLGRLIARNTTPSGARLLERTIFADSALVTDTRIDHAMAIADQPDSGQVTYEIARVLANWRAIRPQWRSDLLSAVTADPRPTLIVWGEQDRVLPAHHLNAVAELMPYASTQLLSGAGHAPQIERPGEFAAVLTSFLQNLTKTRARRR